LHGDMAQPVRMETLQGFKDAKVEILVCSDVAARGLDIPAVSHVFNFDVPSNPEDYVHRIGRTGRAGRSGKAFTLVMPEDGKALGAVTRLIGRKLPAISLDGAVEAEADEDDADEAPREARSQGSGQRRGRGRRGGVKGESRADSAQSNGTGRQHDDREAGGKRANDKRPDGSRKDRGRDRGERKPSDQPSNPTPSFGDHTPAFLLRPVKLAALA
ncbi:MAG: helicase-related protein, partial [Kiloniellales bacterium]